jgi:hypothetical protein
MPDIVVGSDLQLRIRNQNTWTAARDATAAEGGVTGTNAVRNKKSSGGKFDNSRTFLAFDTSGIDVAPSSAKITIRTLSFNSSDFYLVKVQAGTTGDSGTEFANSDYNLLQGFSSGNTMDGNVVTYSSEVDPSTNTTTEITLNATALSDIASLDEFKVAVVASRDYTNTEPGTGNQTTNFKTVADGTASYRPTLSYVAGTAGDTPQQQRNKRRRRRSKGARGKGFASKNISVTTGGKTVANGFSED